eukprot:TRINITY_DN491_c1_g1_i1.p1 TRINITY_DN491_c1_g1~~TRINITY_DN491_c1_g1_i1.p1  ORF type:complete len:115 (-),score=1.65 TRINITY_DN491_c1_g1_i1:595-939(-)
MAIAAVKHPAINGSQCCVSLPQLKEIPRLPTLWFLFPLILYIQHKINPLAEMACHEPKVVPHQLYTLLSIYSHLRQHLKDAKERQVCPKNRLCNLSILYVQNKCSHTCPCIDKT